MAITNQRWCEQQRPPEGIICGVTTNVAPRESYLHDDTRTSTFRFTQLHRSAEDRPESPGQGRRKAKEGDPFRQRTPAACIYNFRTVVEDKHGSYLKILHPGVSLPVHELPHQHHWHHLAALGDDLLKEKNWNLDHVIAVRIMVDFCSGVALLLILSLLSRVRRFWRWRSASCRGVLQS